VLLGGQAAAGIVGAVVRAVKMSDRGPVAVLEVVLAVGARFDAGWGGDEDSLHPSDLSPGDDILPSAGPAAGQAVRKFSGSAASACPHR
jgi:hypothetical protein